MPHGNLTVSGPPSSAGRRLESRRDRRDDSSADPQLPPGWWILPGAAVGLAFWVSLFWLVSLWT